MYTWEIIQALLMHINSLYLNTPVEITFSIIDYYIRLHFPKPAPTIAKDSSVPLHATKASDLRLPMDHSSSNHGPRKKWSRRDHTCARNGQGSTCCFKERNTLQIFSSLITQRL